MRAAPLAMLLLAFALRSAAAPLATGLDHVPVAVSDLDAAARTYRRLGFTLKPGRVHEDGIRNLHAKFADGTELELITAATAVDDTTRAYVALLASGEGPAYLGLYAPDAQALLARLSGLSPRYRRAGPLVMRPEDDRLGFLFFGPRNASPTDRPEYFVHANGAGGLVGAWLALDDADAADVRALLVGVGATLDSERVCVPDCLRATVARLGDGYVVFLPLARQRVPGRPVVGVALAARDATVAARTLAAAGVGSRTIRRADGGHSTFVAPADSHGLWLEFREGRPR